MTRTPTARSIPLARSIAGLALVCTLAITGCASSSSTPANPGCPDKDDASAMAGPKVSGSVDSGGEAQVAVVNAYCPIAGAHAIGKNKVTSASLTRTFKGQSVGFCCDNCPPVWDTMTDVQRQRALDAVMAKESADTMNSN